MPGRKVTLILCTSSAALLGATPPFTVTSDGDRDVEDVVAAAAELLQVDVRVLRILAASDEPDVSGYWEITYLAEVDAPPVVKLAPWPTDPLTHHPRRASYAEPGGHQDDLDWASTTLRSRGIRLNGRPAQVRTWCLSSIWRLPTDRGPVWLKVAPTFCAPEAAIMPLLDERVVPEVLGAKPCRVLLANVPGEDQYGASLAEVQPMARLLVALQAQWTSRVAELEGLGVVDKRAPAALPGIYSVVDRHRHELDDDARRRLDGLVERLPERFSALEACGIPDTLVHGDFYPGNVRGRPGSYRILDWGDCGIGNPMLDLRPACERLGAADLLEWTSLWADEWALAIPGCDARRAAELTRPLGPLLGAATYQKFLDSSEPDDQWYFDGDPADALRAALHALPASETSASPHLHGRRER